MEVVPQKTEARARGLVSKNETVARKKHEGVEHKKKQFQKVKQTSGNK